MFCARQLKSIFLGGPPARRDLARIWRESGSETVQGEVLGEVFQRVKVDARREFVTNEI